MEKIKEESLYTSDSDRVLLILDDIFASFSRYSTKKSALYALLSKFLLLPQRRTLAITIYKLGSESAWKIKYHSVEDPLLKREFEEKLSSISQEALRDVILPLDGTSYGICFHIIEFSNDIWGFRLLCKDDEVTAGAYKILRGLITKYRASKSIRDSLGDSEVDERMEILIGFKNLPALRSKGINQEIIGLSETYVVALQKLIDGIYEEVSDSPLVTNIPVGEDRGMETKFPNIFFMVRTKTNTKKRFKNLYDYDLRFIMPYKQATKINNFLVNADACTFSKREHECNVADNHACPTGISEDLLYSTLNSKFGLNSRSFCDYSLSNGIVSFSNHILSSGKGKLDLDKASESEKRFFELTACIFRKVFDNATPSAFILPIVVSGAPWMTIFTITKDYDLEESHSYPPCNWRHNFHFYREVVKESIGRKIRINARGLYLGIFSEVVSELIAPVKSNQDNAKLIERINTANARLSALSLIYPFDILRFELNETVQTKDSYVSNWLSTNFVGVESEHRKYCERHFGVVPLIDNSDCKLSVCKFPNFNYPKVMDTEFLSIEKIQEAISRGIDIFEDKKVTCFKNTPPFSQGKDFWDSFLKKIYVLQEKGK